jgi:hypothetical protein
MSQAKIDKIEKALKSKTLPENTRKSLENSLKKLVGVSGKPTMTTDKAGNVELDYSNKKTEVKPQVANIILKQLGGRSRFVITTGAKDILAVGTTGISFKIPKAYQGINYVKIILDKSKDLYEMEFGKIHASKNEYKVVEKFSRVDSDGMAELFEETTGITLTIIPNVKREPKVSKKSRKEITYEEALKIFNEQEIDVYGVDENDKEIKIEYKQDFDDFEMFVIKTKAKISKKKPKIKTEKTDAEISDFLKDCKKAEN